MSLIEPTVRYARNGDVNIAYQVVGEGDLNLVFVSGFVSHLLAGWEEPRLASFLKRLASFGRVLIFDKRGTGMSDPITRALTQRERVDDIRALMDAVGAERAALFGVSEGGTLCTMFAATYPHRASALVTFGSPAKQMMSPDWPWGWSPGEYDRILADIETNWTKSAIVRNPSLEGDTRYHRWFVRFLQVAASPGMARSLLQLNATIDIRPVLPSLKIPALIIHRTGDPIIQVEQSRYMATHIPGARLLELDGGDHWPWIGETSRLLAEVELFLTGQVHRAGKRPPLGPDALSAREKQIIRLAVEGYSATQIARELFISKRTVESHLANAYIKLGVESKLQLARRAVELGI